MQIGSAVLSTGRKVKSCGKVTLAYTYRSMEPILAISGTFDVFIDVKN